MTIEKICSLFIVLPTAEICGANLELKLRWRYGIEGTRVSDNIRIQNDPMRPSCFMQTTSASKSFECDLRISSTTTRVASPNTKWVLHPKKTGMTVASSSMRVAFYFSQAQGVCLCFCNLLKSTLTKEKDNSTGAIVHRQLNQSSNKF